MDEVPPNDPFSQLPEVLVPPCRLEDAAESIPIWAGDAELTQHTETRSGSALVFLDTLPRPCVRFEFRASLRNIQNSLIDRFRRVLEGNGLEDGELSCGLPVGKVRVDPLNISSDGTLSGAVRGWSVQPDKEFTSAKFLIINGPLHQGQRT